MKALVVIDMTNDLVFEKYEYEEKVYFGKLVAPLGKTIVNRISGLIKRVVNGGTVSVLRLSKDHCNAFTNPELELKAAELGIYEVFITGLVEEVCIYYNSLGFLKRNFQTNIVRGCTVPFEEERGKDALKELEVCGARMVNDIPEKEIKVILLLEDEHDENSEEIKSGKWPPHNMKGTPGAMTVKEIKNALKERYK